MNRQSDWRDGFLFVGNHPALDLLNTRPVQGGEFTELLGDFRALLRWFRAAGLLSPADARTLWRRGKDSGRGGRTVELVRHLRERLRAEVRSWERHGHVQKGTIDELNRLMAQYPMRTRLKASGGGLSTESWFVALDPEVLLAPLAHSAARLFAEVRHDRVRQCGHCVLHFHDTSKKGTRRWCSMRLCGNRLKVAAYAQRQRRRARR